MYYKFENNSTQIMAYMRNRTSLMNLNILSDVKARATPVTPRLTGDLRNNVPIHLFGRSASITWNMPYAQYQERGANADGSHPVQNYTTPGTGPHFAENAVKEAWSRFGEQWRKAQTSIPIKSK